MDLEINKLIDLAQNTNVHPDFQEGMSEMTEIFKGIKSGKLKEMPPGKFENIIESLVEHIKDDTIIPIEIPAVDPKYTKLLDEFQHVNKLYSDVLEMRKNPQYQKYKNLLDLSYFFLNWTATSSPTS